MFEARTALVGLFVLLPLQSQASAQTTPPPASIHVAHQTERDHVIINRSSYNYGPAVIHDGDTYHLYWCGGVAGDFILHAQATSFNGPWHSTKSMAPASFDVAVRPTTSPRDFDGLHTCDPNVIKVGSTFYLYYSGEASEGALTAIGVAASSDGVHFTRQNNGAPIVTAAKTNPDYAKTHLTYGAGQPAAVFVDPYIYLSFTDSTASGVNKGNGAGQIALRSTDPRFMSGLQELTTQGWQAREPGRHTGEHAYLESFGLDWGLDRQTGTIVAASNRTATMTSIFVLNPSDLAVRGTADIAQTWHEGPALLTASDKSLEPRASCETLPLTVAAAEGESANPFSWNALAYSKADLAIGGLCKR